MIRRFQLDEGDNAPAYGRMELPSICGSGTYALALGFKPSAGMVKLAKQYAERAFAAIGAEEQLDHLPDIDLDPTTPFSDTGINLRYWNIPDFLLGWQWVPNIEGNCVADFTITEGTLSLKEDGV